MSHSLDDRVDRILAELGQRYGNDDRFLTQLRPVLVRIFEPATPEAARAGLLEEVAEACVRNIETRDNCRAAKEAWTRLFDRLRQHVEALAELARRRHGRDRPEPGLGGEAAGG